MDHLANLSFNELQKRLLSKETRETLVDLLESHQLKSTRDYVQVLSSALIIYHHPKMWFPHPTDQESGLINLANILVENLDDRESFPECFMDYHTAYVDFHQESERELFCTLLMDSYDLERKLTDLEEYLQISASNDDGLPSSVNSTGSASLNETLSRMRDSLQKLSESITKTLKHQPTWSNFRDKFNHVILMCNSYHTLSKRPGNHPSKEIAMKQIRDRLEKSCGLIALYFLDQFYMKTQLHGLEEIMEQAFWDLIDQEIGEQDLSYTLIQLKDLGEKISKFYQSHPERMKSLRQKFLMDSETITIVEIPGLMNDLHEEIQNLVSTSQDDDLNTLKITLQESLNDHITSSIGDEENSALWKWLSENFQIFLKNMHRHLNIIQDTLQIIGNGGIAELEQVEQLETMRRRGL